MPAVATRTMTPRAAVAAATPKPASKFKKLTGNVAATLVPLATTYYTENKLSNEHDGKAKGARKQLLGKLPELLSETTGFLFDIQTKDGSILMEAFLDTPEREAMDPRQLWKALDCDKNPKQRDVFFSIVSATKKAVVDHLGEIIANRIAVTVQGETNVKVAPVK